MRSVVISIIKHLYYFVSFPFIYVLLKDNINLKNKFINQECYIFLTGPVVNDIDLSLLKDKKTFICNHFYRHKDIKNMKPLFYSSIENAHKTMRYTNLSEHSKTMIKKLHACSNDTILLLNHTNYFYIRNDKELKNVKKYFFASSRDPITVKTKIDFCKRSPFMKGTVYFLLCLAIYMGFDKIFLIGAGYTLQPYQWFHFYEPYQSEEFRKRVLNLEIKQPENEHNILKEISENNGVQIINVIPEGYKSPIYNAISVEDFKKYLRG